VQARAFERGAGERTFKNQGEVQGSHASYGEIVLWVQSKTLPYGALAFLQSSYSMPLHTYKVTY
jgi:hypothetical protein